MSHPKQWEYIVHIDDKEVKKFLDKKSEQKQKRRNKMSNETVSCEPVNVDGQIGEIVYELMSTIFTLVSLTETEKQLFIKVGERLYLAGKIAGLELAVK